MPWAASSLQILRTPVPLKLKKSTRRVCCPEGVTLCVTDTQASHSELTGEFAAIRREMEAVAACLGQNVLGRVPETAFWQALPRLRTPCGDRAVLRAIHYYQENARRWPRRMPCNEETLRSFCISSGQMAIPRLRTVRTSTAPPTRGIRG